jgi:hypothetical protein
MPRSDSFAFGCWREICATVGIHIIHPTLPMASVLAQIRSTSLLIMEAMHGAIGADALRIPWTSLRPIAVVHRSKWLDWIRSVIVPCHPDIDFPSSARELCVYVTKREAKGKLIANPAASPFESPTRRLSL